MSAPNTCSAWHAASPEAAAADLDVDVATGLSHAEAQSRLARHGPNQLAGKPPLPRWHLFLNQFRNILVTVLLAAALLAGAVGDIKNAVVIAVVVLLNASLGFLQEHRAEAALAALKHMLAPVARVRRNGHAKQIPAADLVRGDILMLEAGDRIPADARVLHAHSAEVSEAALTGESVAISKTQEAVEATATLADRRSMVFMNTIVTRGRLEAVVTATGMHTEMGKIARLLEETVASSTPLQRQLDTLGRRLAALAGVVVAGISVMGLARGDDLVQTAMTAIALAVAAIPEGLPAVVTVTLALGMHHMARRHAIVKKLSAVETLGCTTVICSDKTGTLTLNQMTARRVYCLGRTFSVSGEGYGSEGIIAPDDGHAVPPWALVLAPAALCCDARIHHDILIGDPTEGALLALVAKSGVDATQGLAQSPRIAEIPFDSGHKFMATFHHEGNVVRMWVKGAPEVLLPHASREWQTTGETPLDVAGRDAWASQATTFANAALRVLALAGRTIPASEFDPAGDLMRWTDALTLMALVGIIDPPRPEARAAIRVCQQAGITVKMITGDHRATAAAIAHELGLAGTVYEGHEIEGLDAAELSERVEQAAVFARVSPAHKLAIVAALQARGHVVAMTGDGVNDAPALKIADIGIAMGITGTEVTQEAAALVLTDDNFASIVHAVIEGRTIYENIVKFVRFQLSTNIGAILTVLGAPLVGLPTPFTAIQILWVNLIMDGPPAMTLGVEPAQPGIMNTPPRATSTPILSLSRLGRIATYGLTMAAGTLAAYAWGAQTGGADSRAYAETLAFTTFVLFQFFNIFNARAESGSAFNPHFFRNGKLWLALIGIVGLQVLVVHWGPAQAVFDTVDLRACDWLLATTLGASVLLLDEARKAALRVCHRPHAAG